MKATRDGDKPLNPHMLRHSYATRLVERGVPIHDVQAALGRWSLATRQVYLHVDNDKLADRLRDALADRREEPEVEQFGQTPPARGASDYRGWIDLTTAVLALSPIQPE
jgi:hypothetical protein